MQAWEAEVKSTDNRAGKRTRKPGMASLKEAAKAGRRGCFSRKMMNEV